jgi:hypothetical protein
MVADLTVPKSMVLIAGLPEQNPLRRRPDISCGRDLAGSEPAISVGDGRKRAIPHIRNTVEQRSNHLERAAE